MQIEYAPCEDRRMNAYSKDLRIKALGALERAMPRKEAASTFEISLATLKRRRQGEDLTPKPLPGRTRAEHRLAQVLDHPKPADDRGASRDARAQEVARVPRPGGRGGAPEGPRILRRDRYSIADIALYAYTHVAHEGGFDLGRFPSINAWLERVAAQPGHVPITRG